MSAPRFRVRQEPDVLSSGRLAGVGLSFVVIGLLGVLSGGAILATTVGTVKPSFAGSSGPRPAPSHLSQVEQTPILDSRAGEVLRDAQRRELESWSWVDRDAGVARIPIEHAMDLVAAEPSR